MRILQVLDSYPPDLNGGAYFIHRLSKQLIEDGVDVLVICPSRSQKTYYDQYDSVPLYRVKSYPVFLYKDFRISIPFKIEKLIESAIINFKPDVIHLQGRFFLGKICSDIAGQYNIPKVATNHFMPDNFFHYFFLPEFLRNYFSTWAWRWVKQFFDEADIWTTPTTTAATLLKDRGFNRDIRVVSCGVDTEKFYPDRKSKSSLTFIPSDTIKNILYTGRIDKEKNLHILFQAFVLLIRRLPCRLIIVGSGSELKALKKLTRQLTLNQHVIFTGRLSDEEYPHVFHLADCYFHAGTAELQSISTLEAVASGLPIVAANAMALPELVKHQVNGYLFDPMDFESAANYLHTILTDDELADRMSQESRRIAMQHHIKTTSKKYSDIYAELIHAN